MYEEALHGMYVSHYRCIGEMQSLCRSFEFWRSTCEVSMAIKAQTFAVKVLTPLIEGPCQPNPPFRH